MVNKGWASGAVQEYSRQHNMRQSLTGFHALPLGQVLILSDPLQLLMLTPQSQDDFAV